jgi:hypothetical protein
MDTTVFFHPPRAVVAAALLVAHYNGLGTPTDIFDSKLPI